jgi:hypothetical protein
LVGAWSRFEVSHKEGDWQIARNAKTEVQGIRSHVIRMRGEAGVEGDEESDAAVKSANEELARVGNSLETADLVSDRAPIVTSTVPTNLVGDGFWEPVHNFPSPNSDRVALTTSTYDSIIIDTVPNTLNSLQVEAEMNDERLNHPTNPTPPAATIAPSCQRRSRPALSVASSQRDLRIAQNEAARIAHLAQSSINKEERDLEEREEMEAARIAANAKTEGSKVRQELERRRFEVEATLTESLAQLEDENVSDLVSSHGLDATSISNWVGTTHGQTM